MSDLLAKGAFGAAESTTLNPRSISAMNVESTVGGDSVEDGAMAEPWGKISTDYKANFWMKDQLEIPFLEAQFKRFADHQGGVPWKALDVGCGAGKYTLRLLQAGASIVLANDLSASMVEEAKKETDKCLLSPSLTGSADFHVISATSLSSIPGVQEGTFDLAICVYVFSNLLSAEEIKQAFAEIFKMLKPGGKLMWYESHVIRQMQTSNYRGPGIDMKPKEDGTEWNYYEDEGKPREIFLTMNTGNKIRFNSRYYTLSSWVSFMVEAGFQITQLLEPCLDPKTVPTNAADYAISSTGQPIAMFWECTKPLSQ